MLCIQSPIVAARGIGRHRIISRRRISRLLCLATLRQGYQGRSFDVVEINRFTNRLAWWTVHTVDLRRAIPGDVQLGAVIAAATALGFGVHSWFGVTTFAPHALIAINQSDVRRQMTKYHP
jgi:hypothetical protein